MNLLQFSLQVQTNCSVFFNKLVTIVINNVIADCISVVLTHAGGVDSTEKDVVYVI